jgi:RHS repeat-associated protein
VYHANIFGVYEADVTAPNGYTHTYNLSSYYGSVKPDSMSGAPIPSVGGSAFYYDSNGFLRRWDDYNGNQTRFSFNSRGLDTYREEAYGTAIERDISTTWSTSWRLPTQIVEPLRTTNFTYDTTGNMLTRSVVAGGNTRTWTYTYNTNGQVLTADGPRTDISDVTTYTYDTHGNIATITDALSHVTSFTSYDANGRPLSITDPNGLVTTLTYDARGRLLTSTAGTELTSYTYDNAGNLTKITRPDSSYLSYAYDNAHRLTGISDILGNSIAYTLDNAGNKTAIKVYDPSSTLVRTRTFTYDNINDLLTMIGASSQTTTYGHDSNGNLTSVIDPLTHETDYSYDALNRISTSTDANSAETHLAYNANNDITSIEDPRSLTTTYTVDGLSNVTNIASPDTGSTAKTYDAAGNVITSTDARSDTTTYTYDALNRRTGATYADSTSVSWTYDQGTYGKGHLTTMVDLVGTSTWTYNIHGSVTQKQQAIGSVTLTTGFSYDSYGRLSTITYPSGRTATYSYNTAGQVSGVTTGSTALLSSVTYMPFGPVSGWTEGSGAPHARSFDLDGRLTGIVIGSTPTVPTVATQTYGYDTASRITSLTETSLADKGFSYDDVNRLTNLTIGTGSTAISTDYAYDDDSNRTTTTIAAGTTSYNYPSGNNKLSTLSGLVSVTYSYDAAGNMTADGTNSWSYGANGRMSSVTIGSTTTTYGINGLGQRIKKVGAGVLPSGTRQFVYNLQGQLLGEYDGSGNMLKETVWLGSLPVALMVGTGTSAANYYINPDNLTSPHIITDTTGNQVWNWDKLAFGDNAPNQNPSGLGTFYYHPRFPGQYADAESGLNYNMARDYNPALGRYIESDPLGLFAGINTYAYASNSPINIDDPYGLDCPSDLNPLNPDNPIQMASNDTNWQDKFVGAVDTLATRLGQGVGGGTGGTLAPAAKAIDQAQKLRQNLDDSSSAANSMYGQDIQTQSNIVDQQLNKFYPNQPK